MPERAAQSSCGHLLRLVAILSQVCAQLVKYVVSSIQCVVLLLLLLLMVLGCLCHLLPALQCQAVAVVAEPCNAGTCLLHPDQAENGLTVS